MIAKSTSPYQDLASSTSVWTTDHKTRVFFNQTKSNRTLLCCQMTLYVSTTDMCSKFSQNYLCLSNWTVEFHSCFRVSCWGRQNFAENCCSRIVFVFKTELPKFSTLIEACLMCSEPQIRFQSKNLGTECGRTKTIHFVEERIQNDPSNENKNTFTFQTVMVFQLHLTMFSNSSQYNICCFYKNIAHEIFPKCHKAQLRKSVLPISAGYPQCQVSPFTAQGNHFCQIRRD